jgi:dolichol kinase
MKKRKGDLARLERELGAITSRVKGEAHAAADRVMTEAQAAAERVRQEANSAAERVRGEAQAAASRVKDEAPRKAIHFAMIVLPLGILYLPVEVFRRSLMVVGALLLVIDLVKIHHPKLRSYFTAFFGHLIRRHEHAEITGSTYMIVSALLASYLFDREVAAASLVFLIVGDTLAAIVGKAWGRTRICGAKTLEGFLAGLLSSFVAATLLVPDLSLFQTAVAALTASIIEILPIPVDDNFRIPIVSGLVSQWLR